MPLLSIVVTLVIVGFILWLVNTLIPMDGTVKRVVNGFILLLVFLWLINMLFPSLGTWHVR